MSEWQPIETAPRDGTPILVFNAYSSRRGGKVDSYYMEIAFWENTSWGGNWRIEAFAPPQDKDPTHWMPLPEPPK